MPTDRELQAGENTHRFRRERRCAAALALALVAALSGAAVAAPVDDAASDIAADFVSRLPRPIPFETLGVVALEGDDGTLERAILSELVASSDREFRVIERQALERLFEEQHLQLSDVISDPSRVRPGEIQGVDAILFGSVEEALANPLFARLRAGLQLDLVESGEVVGAGTYTAASLSAGGIAAAGGAAVLAFALASAVTGRRRRARDSVSLATDDRKILALMLIEVDRARDYLVEARARLVEGEAVDAIRAIQDIEEDLRNLRQRIECAPDAGLARPGDPVGAVRLDRRMVAPLQQIAEESDRLLKVAGKVPAQVCDQARALKKQVLDAKTLLRERSAYARG